MDNRRTGRGKRKSWVSDDVDGTPSRRMGDDSLGVKRKRNHIKDINQERVASSSILTFKAKPDTKPVKYEQLTGGCTILSMYADGGYFGKVTVLRDEITIEGPYKVIK